MSVTFSAYSHFNRAVDSSIHSRNILANLSTRVLAPAAVMFTPLTLIIDIVNGLFGNFRRNNNCYQSRLVHNLQRLLTSVVQHITFVGLAGALTVGAYKVATIGVAYLIANPAAYPVSIPIVLTFFVAPYIYRVARAIAHQFSPTEFSIFENDYHINRRHQQQALRGAINGAVPHSRVPPTRNSYAGTPADPRRSLTAFPSSTQPQAIYPSSRQPQPIDPYDLYSNSWQTTARPTPTPTIQPAATTRATTQKTRRINIISPNNTTPAPTSATTSTQPVVPASKMPLEKITDAQLSEQLRTALNNFHAENEALSDSESYLDKEDYMSQYPSLIAHIIIQLIDLNHLPALIQLYGQTQAGENLKDEDRVAIFVTLSENFPKKTDPEQLALKQGFNSQTPEAAKDEMIANMTPKTKALYTQILGITAAFTGPGIKLLPDVVRTDLSAFLLPLLKAKGFL